ncbi:MAG: DMT family transporter [Thermostichus sp. DG02_5_bins_236]
MKHLSGFLALAAAACFAAVTPVSKLLLEELSPFQLAGILYLGAAVGILPNLWRDPSRYLLPQVDRRNRQRLAGAVFCGGVLGPVFLLLGLQLASAASVALWLPLEMLATAILGHFLFRDQLGRLGWLAAGILFLASLLLSWGEGAAGFQAGLWVAMACLCWGIDNNLTALIDGLRPTQVTFWKGGVAGTINLSIGLILEPWQASGFTVISALGIGIISYGASLVLYIIAAQGLGAIRSQLLFSTSPYFGVGIATLLLGEKISFQQLISMGLVAASLGLLFRDQHDHEHEHLATEHEHWHHHGDGHHEHVHSEFLSSTHHRHRHQHSPLVHSHPHLPDLHHRHRHTS